jgi:hypothetical protein
MLNLTFAADALFCQDTREELKAAGAADGVKPSTLSRMCADKWKLATEEVRDVCLSSLTY